MSLTKEGLHDAMHDLWLQFGAYRQDSTVYVSARVMQMAAAEGIDVDNFYWQNYGAKVRVLEPINGMGP